MGPLLGDQVEVFRHQNNLSLIREDDLHGELTGPRIQSDLAGAEHPAASDHTLRNLAPTVETLATLEGLDAHAEAVRVRLRPDDRANDGMGRP